MKLSSKDKETILLSLERIKGVIQQFAQEERGNRLSNFSLSTLQQTVHRYAEDAERVLKQEDEKDKD